MAYSDLSPSLQCRKIGVDKICGRILGSRLITWRADASPTFLCNFTSIAGETREGEVFTYFLTRPRFGMASSGIIQMGYICLCAFNPHTVCSKKNPGENLFICVQIELINLMLWNRLLLSVKERNGLKQTVVSRARARVCAHAPACLCACVHWPQIWWWRTHW